MAKDVFEKMFGSDAAADEIVAAEGLTQIDDESQIVGADRATCWPATPTRSRSTAPARRATFGFLVGQVMKATGGKANPKRVNELLKRALEA